MEFCLGHIATKQQCNAYTIDYNYVENNIFKKKHCCAQSSKVDPTPLPLAQLCHAQTLVHVKEYIRTIRALVLNTHVIPFNETMKVFCLLHHLLKLISFLLSIISILIRRLLQTKRNLGLGFDGLLGMVFELLQKYFVPHDFASGFGLFFKVCGHIA
jgi:hypothetical protein